MQNPLLSVHKWRVLPLTIAPQQYHIDLSEQLLMAALPGEPATLYWSQAESTGLVLGFSQKESVLNQAALITQPITLYHRRAGGTAVLVGPKLLSLDVILPAGHPLILADIVESYRWFGTVWVKTLGSLGVETRLVLPDEAHAQRALLKQEATQSRETILNRACFGSLSSYEVIAEERKVVGLDMIRRRTGSLLQAGLLLEWDIEPIVELLGHTPEEQAILREGLPERAIGLETLTGRTISATEVISVFEEALSTIL
ncbi:MAG: lipoyl protein ligase domain-containing protein [Ktedonobacteraceae bacterium]